MLELPFFTELSKANNILLAGAGGGFDIFCGLPLYFGLRRSGKNVHLANLSFSFLPPPPATTKEQWLSPHLLKVTADTPNLTDYFPEFYLAQWFQKQGLNTPVYCFENTGVQQLIPSYQILIQHLNLDTIILVDGGTDSLMKGDEADLGTPQEDMTSIVAVNELTIDRKMLVCLGFGIERGICNAQVLEAVAELTQRKGYLGMFSLLQEMPEVQLYRSAATTVFKAMPKHISIVSSSIFSALEGHYGNYHVISRTRNSKLWINPLMSVYWCFWLTPVAQQSLYLDAMRTTKTYFDVMRVIVISIYK